MHHSPHITNPQAKTWTLTLLLSVFALGAATVLLFDSTASAQSPPPNLLIQNLAFNQSGISPSAVTYNAQVTIVNFSDTDFSGAQRVDYQIDDGDKQLAYIVTDLRARQTLTFAFSFDLPPGEHTLRVEVGESAIAAIITVAGADIDVEITDYRLKSGRTVEFDLKINNSGDLIAEDLTLTSAWQDADSELSTEQTYSDDIPDIRPGDHTNIILPLRLDPGSYRFSFSANTTTIEGETSNNSAEKSLDVEFIDLRTTVVSSESLGWDGDGKALMSITVEVTNHGVDDSSIFNVGVECDDEWEGSCSTSSQSDKIPAGESAQTEMRLWLPVGDTATRIFAAEDEDSFRWGNLNAIDHIIEAPEAPDLVWTLNNIDSPQVASYWSDGSANVDIDLTFVNNGTHETQVVTIDCSRDDAALDGCGAEFEVEIEKDVYPTVVSQTIRLPHGETDLTISYGDTEPKATSASVPQRITGVERDVWECFSDTSFLDAEDIAEDLGIGCGGWRKEYVRKWPNDKVIKVWSTGNSRYLEIFEEVLLDLADFLNLEFEFVDDKDQAHFLAYAGVPVEDAEAIEYKCTDFGGCGGFREVNPNGVVSKAGYVVWEKPYWSSETRHYQWVRAATLHELLHALTGIKHRHHDRTSVMSYDALDYTTIDGIDRGLFQLLMHPLVEPGMTFDEVLELIVFADQLNDPPEPEELSAPALLRRAHAIMMDAGAVRFQMQGIWPGYGCGYQFGPATHEVGNLKLGREYWIHFHNRKEHYFTITRDPHDPFVDDDRELIEYWKLYGHTWRKVNANAIHDHSYFRDYWSNPIDMLSHINIWAKPSDYTVVSRTSNLVVLKISLDGPNSVWSHGVDVDVRIEMNPETFKISEYQMIWDFKPRNPDNCKTYKVEARNGEYGFEFKFPEQIIEKSALLD